MAVWSLGKGDAESVIMMDHKGGLSHEQRHTELLRAGIGPHRLQRGGLWRRVSFLASPFMRKIILMDEGAAGDYLQKPQ